MELMPAPAAWGMRLFAGNRKVNGVVFDLTSEQFGGKPLTFSCENPQSREVHFADKEKYERYLYLKRELLKRLR